jgi:hypothetical protein
MGGCRLIPAARFGSWRWLGLKFFPLPWRRLRWCRQDLAGPPFGVEEILALFSRALLGHDKNSHAPGTSPRRRRFRSYPRCS